MQPAPTFDSEYEKMALSWKDNGVNGYYFHKSEDIFSLNHQQIEKIRIGITTEKNSSRNEKVKELGGIYLELLDFLDSFSGAVQLKETLSNEDVPFCENQEKYNELIEKFESVSSTKKVYLESVNSFVSSNPELSDKISLYETEFPNDTESLEKMVLAMEIIRKEC